MLYYYSLLEELPSTTPAPPVVKVVGSFDAWEKKRRIPVEQLREILKEQGSPWANELGDTYQVAEQRLLGAPKTKKHQKVLNEVLETVSESVATPIDWGPVIASVRAAAEAERTTLAIKHAEAALRAMRKERDREEEEVELLMHWFIDG